MLPVENYSTRNYLSCKIFLHCSTCLNLLISLIQIIHYTCVSLQMILFLYTICHVVVVAMDTMDPSDVMHVPVPVDRVADEAIHSRGPRTQTARGVSLVR